MAMIICPECKAQISDKAAACIKCGYPISNCHEFNACESDKKQTGLNNEKKSGSSDENKDVEHRGRTPETSVWFAKIFKTTAAKILAVILSVVILVTSAAFVGNHQKDNKDSEESKSNVIVSDQVSSQGTESVAVKLKTDITSCLGMSFSDLLAKKGEDIFNPKSDIVSFWRRGGFFLELWNGVYCCIDSAESASDYTAATNDSFVKENDGIIIVEKEIKVFYSGKFISAIGNYSNFFDGFIPGMTAEDLQKNIGYPVKVYPNEEQGEGFTWKVISEDFVIWIDCKEETKIESLDDITEIHCQKIRKEGE